MAFVCTYVKILNYPKSKEFVEVHLGRWNVQPKFSGIYAPKISDKDII